MTATGAPQKPQGSALAAIAILAQWPLCVTLFEARGGWVSNDTVTLAAWTAGLLLWIAGSRGPSWCAACLVGGSCLLTAAAYLGLRVLPLVPFLGVASGVWLVTTFALARTRSAAAPPSLAVSVLLVGLILIESLVGLPVFARRTAGAADAGIASVRYEGQISAPDRAAFTQPVPLGYARHSKVLTNGRPDFDVEYHIDRYGSRVVTARPERGDDWYLFGCSFTFGEGLSDDETIAAELQRLHPEARLFNFGLRNAGTSDAWIHLTRHITAGETPVWNVYFFIEDHFRRVALRDLTVATEGSRPRVVIADGRPRYLGRADLTMGSALDRLRINLIGRSRAFRALGGLWQPSDDTVDLVVQLGRSMDDATRGVPRARFLFVVLPSRTTYWPQRIDRLKTRLRQEGVAVLDADRLMTEYLRQNGGAAPSLYFTDGHPRATYTSLVAGWVDRYVDQQRAP